MNKINIALATLAAVVASTAYAHEDGTPTQPKPAAAVVKPQQPQGQNHSGGTDSKGCHTNHSTGDYHCHNPKKSGS